MALPADTLPIMALLSMIWKKCLVISAENLLVLGVGNTLIPSHILGGTLAKEIIRSLDILQMPQWCGRGKALMKKVKRNHTEVEAGVQHIVSIELVLMTDVVESQHSISEIASLAALVLFLASFLLLVIVAMEVFVGFLIMIGHLTVSVTTNQMTICEV